MTATLPTLLKSRWWKQLAILKRQYFLNGFKGIGELEILGN